MRYSLFFYMVEFMDSLLKIKNSITVFFYKIFKNKTVLFFSFLIINIVISLSVQSITQNDEDVKDSALPFLLWILFGITLIPFIEEVAFRLPLTIGKYNWVSLILLLVCVLATSRYPLLCIGIIVFMGVIIVNYFYTNRLVKMLLIVLSIFNFGFLHLVIYEDVDFLGKNILELSSLVAPQLFAGVALVLMRLKGGFWFAVSYHATYNFTFIVIGTAYFYFLGLF